MHVYDKPHYAKLPDGVVTSWEEPSEPYWVWNAALQSVDPVKGLQQPKGKRMLLSDTTYSRAVLKS
jgi:hypothetical protein